MAHLITGYAGKEHITSADQGSFNASFFGTGEFVMEAGQQFAASITSNNNVRILDGDLLMQGRHIRIATGTYEDITIETGTAGVNRYDLICMTYKKDASNGTESAYIEVIKGEESENPTEPEYTAGDILSGADFAQMPLYKVYIEGVVLQSIEKLFTTKPTYEALANEAAEKYAALAAEAAEAYKKACEEAYKGVEILDSVEEISENTESGKSAGALALKETLEQLEDKVSKEAGKGLSTNDYSDAEKEKVANAASVSNMKNATLSASGWTGEAVPYSYELAVDGATESTNIEILPPAEMTQEQYDAITAACIVGGTQAEGSITLQAWGEVPMIDIPIRVLVRGD